MKMMNLASKNQCSRRRTGTVQRIPISSVSRPSRPSGFNAMPPLVSFGIWDLSYGLSVDIYDGGLWREGVIFDYNDGSTERAVFLPDSCSELKTVIKFLRIGQERDTVTGVWKRRGTWTLLKLVEKSGLDLSVREVLCKLKEKVGCLKSLEARDEKSVIEVLKELQESEFSSVKDSVSGTTEEFNRPSAMYKEDSQAYQVGSDHSGLPVKNPAASPSMEIDDAGNDSVTAVDELLMANGDDLESKKQTSTRRDWLMVTPGMIPAAEFCPNAITRYVSLDATKRSKAALESLAMEARKHISYLGWKIEYRTTKRRDRYVARIYRYTSPDSSKVYLSLRQLCLDLHIVKSVKGSPVISADNLTADTELFSYRAQAGKRKRQDDLPESSSEDVQSDDTKLDAIGSLKESKPGQQDDEDISLTKHTRRKVIADSRKEGNLKKRKGSQKRKRTVLSRRTMLSSLIDNNVLSPGAKVHYRSCKNRGPLTTGRITRDGIECDCCQKILTLTAFEAHAGSTYHRPAANIILEADGRTLFQCHMEMRNQPKEMPKGPTNPKRERKRQHAENNMICSICRDGGDLILCDRCPLSFHTGCLGVEKLPDGEWFCISCRCGICNEGGIKEGDSMVPCCQCRRKYHADCLRNRNIKLDDNWFCSIKCRDISSALEGLVGRSLPVGPHNISWTLLTPSYNHNTKLKAALKVMQESFESVEDPCTGRDLVKDIFSGGSELNQLDLTGFYIVVLEKKSRVASVACLRIHGDKVAEIPLACTRFKFRRMGMCKMLMNELEKQLRSLGVETLLLPSAENVLNTWKDKFGFSEVSDKEISEYLEHTILDFQDTILCRKHIPKEY